jgi:hypothetical protein
VTPAVHRAARLTGLLFLIALLTSRLTLVVHELAGHALPALLVGSHRVDFELFWFAGGYVSFARELPYDTGERLFISLGGIGLELIAGVAGLAIARLAAVRARPVLRLALLGVAAINLVHGLYYLATGAHHGFGDGWLLHRELAGARGWIAWPVAALAVIATFAVARLIGGVLRSWLADHRAVTQVAMIAGGVAVAGGLHAALTFGELAVRSDRTYDRVMEHQDKRDAARELARYLAEQRRRGVVVDKRQVEVVRERLEDEHRPFPLDIVLALALGAAAIAGTATARPDRSAAAGGAVPRWRQLRGLAMATAAALALVIALAVL